MRPVGARVGFAVVGLALLTLAAVAAPEVLFLALALAAIGLPFLVIGVRSRWDDALAGHVAHMASDHVELRKTTLKVVAFALAGALLFAQGGLGWLVGGGMLLGAAGVGGFVADAWRARRLLR